MDFWQILIELIALIGAAILLGALFERLRLSALSGYLLAGAILGPGALNLISSGEAVSLLAEMGVVLLLFSIGLEFSPRSLRQLGPLPFFGGLAQMAGTALLIAGVCLLLGLPLSIASAIGIMAAPSSTAVVLRILREGNGLESIHGRTSLGILLLQDAALVPLVLIMSALAGGGGMESVLAGLGYSLLAAAGLVAVFFIVITWIFPFLLKETSHVAGREPFIMLAVVTCFLAAWSAHSVGISPALGAFIAGMLLADQPFAVQVRADVGALRVLFVTLFFASVGMLADASWLAGHAGTVALTTVVILVIKFLLVTVILCIARQPLRHAIAAGIMLSMVGEFSFLLADIAAGGGMLSGEVRNYVLSVTILSLFFSPLLVKWAPAIANRLEKLLRRRKKSGLSDMGGADPTEEKRVIVVGLGPAGMRVVDRLRARGLAVVGLDLNANLVRALQKKGGVAYIGDAAHPEILEHLHAGQAAAIVVTVPDPGTAIRIISHVRQRCPQVPLVARSRWDRYHREIEAAGAEIAINEEDVVGDSLGEAVLQHLA